jgi:ligand-binding sensor domain-containing protein/signal transduction histidine kinase
MQNLLRMSARKIVLRRLRRRGKLFQKAFLLVILLALPTQAERLSVKIYTSAQGLGHSYVARIFRDPQGFLWFCTSDGLSRYDGQNFTTYGLDDGLAFPSFTYFLRTSDNAYWAATNGSGVCRFNDFPTPPDQVVRISVKEKTKRLFTVYPVGDSKATNRINSLYEDRDGRLWAGSDAGLFMMNLRNGEKTFTPVELKIPMYSDKLVQIWTILEDGEGSLWIGTKYGLVRRLPDGRMLHYRLRLSSENTDTVYALMIDRENRFWLGHQAGLLVFKPRANSLTIADNTPPWNSLTEPKTTSTLHGAILPTTEGEARWLTTADGLGGNTVLALNQFLNGHIYIITTESLTEFDGKRFQVFSKAEGLSERLTPTIVEDIAGNIWMASVNDGVIKIIRNGFVTFGEADGLQSNLITQIFSDQSGETYFFGAGWQVCHFDENRFTSVRLNLPANISDAKWNGSHKILKDHMGDWWITTNEGLFRFPQVNRFEELASVRPKVVYTKQDGLAGNDVTRLFEDAHGDIWISTFAPDREVVSRWERATEKFTRYSDADGLPPLNSASAYCEDGAGNLWIGFRDDGVARYKDGKFTQFTKNEGIPEGVIYDIHMDRAKRLWIASLGSPGGLLRTDNSDALLPDFKKYTTADGLASTRILCMAEDALGRMYIGTSRGVDRLDPQTDEIKNYTVADGLLTGDILTADTDRNGYIWVSTRQGLLRLTPESGHPTPPPPAMISGLQVAGTIYDISPFGQFEITGLEFGPNENQLQIDFLGLSFSTGAALRFQYKIEGAAQDWSAPTEQRTVNASLQPGTYRFLVRAVTTEGVMSLQPASISFTILRPLWQRWWFVTLAILLLAYLSYIFYRYRVSRLVELERVRTRIATDLHDDIGSSLSQVSVLSEVINRRIGSNSDVAEPLSMIAGLSRDLADSMNDIVWAINPARDHLSDLSHRMRRFASDVFTARDLKFSFHAPDDQHDVRMGADMRREVFLIFKESVNNVVRHSQCAEADIEFTVKDGWLRLVIKDNGKGFKVDSDKDGNGLTSMHRRAQKLDGILRIFSEEGLGTTVTLRAPIGRRKWRRNRQT